MSPMTKALLLLPLVLGCQTTTSTPPDAGTSSSGTCGSISDQMLMVGTTFTDEPLPVATGGSVDDGTYRMTARYQHIASSGGPYEDINSRITLGLRGDRFETVGQVEGEALTRGAGGFRIDGSTLELANECPRSGVTRFGLRMLDGGLELTSSQTSVRVTYQRVAP